MSRGENKSDGVEIYAADTHDMQSYRQAEKALSELPVPMLVHASNSHEKLYVACFDGTGNSLYKDDPAHDTNVAKLFDQIRKSNPSNIKAEYVEGIGTQDNYLVNKLDNIRGYTYQERIEAMYYLFIKQAREWLKQDPNVQIRLADIGFSRGSEEAASFARLVAERGIQNPDGMKVIKGIDGHIERLEPTKPPLVPPGQTAQAVGLFDPVGTGEPKSHSRQLPPSVISGFQITAEDERRDEFLSDHLLHPGRSDGDRFLNVTVGGAHCNIGGGYALDGLSRLSGNLMTDYLNALSDKPFLDKQPVYDDPRHNVVHRSEQGEWFYTTGVAGMHAWMGVDETNRRGFDSLVTTDADREKIGSRGAQPRDEALNRQFEHRAAPIAPVPDMPAPVVPDRKPSDLAPPAGTGIGDFFNRLTTAVNENDVESIRAIGRDYARTDAGRTWLQAGSDYNQARKMRNRQDMLREQALAQSPALSRNGSVLQIG